MNKVMCGRIDTLKNAPPLWGSGGGGITAIGWSGWSGGKAGSEERCFPPLAVLSHFNLFPTVMNHCCNISRCQCIIYTASQSHDFPSKTNIPKHPYFVGFIASFLVVCPEISLHSALSTSYMKLRTKAKILIELTKLKAKTHHFLSFHTCQLHAKIEHKNVTCKLHSSYFSPESNRMISISVRRPLMFRFPFSFFGFCVK